MGGGPRLRSALCRLACAGLAALVCAGLRPGGAVAAAQTEPPPAPAPAPSADVLLVADWIARTGDNGRLPFIIVDKPSAEVFAYDRDGKLAGRAPALLGAGEGDESLPGIGQRKLATIKREERTTPAGRFVAAIGPTLGKDDVLWVDYDAAVSLHRVIPGAPADRRLQRLQTPTALDNRITYGCINVPVSFFEGVIRPAFLGRGGIVYILPEIRALETVFPVRSDSPAPAHKAGG